MSHVQVERRIMGSLSSKLYGFEKVLSPLVTKACIAVCPKNKNNFNVDNVRVVKIPGGGVHDSLLVHGVVIRRDPEGSIRSAKKAKVAVFAQGVDTASTETKVRCSHHSRTGRFTQAYCLHIPPPTKIGQS